MTNELHTAVTLLSTCQSLTGGNGTRDVSNTKNSQLFPNPEPIQTYPAVPTTFLSRYAEALTDFVEKGPF